MYQLVTVNAQEVDHRFLKIFRGRTVRRLKQGREIHHDLKSVLLHEGEMTPPAVESLEERYTTER